MQTFFTNDIKLINKILDYFYTKKICFTYSEQYTFLKEYEYKGEKGVNLSLDKSTIYLFQWKDKKVKKEHLMAL